MPLCSALKALGLGWFVIVGTSGCQATSSLESAGLAVVVPGLWHPVDTARWMVPGKTLAAWAGPEGSSLVIYQTLPGPGVTPTMIAEGLANRLTNLPGLKVLIKRVETIAGQPAARVEVVAPGSGAMLAPSGLGAPVATDGQPLMATRQVTVGFTRARGTLFLSWHLPEQAYTRIAPDIEAVLGSLTLTPDTATPSSTY
jgi:hypothetical protein